MRKALIGFLIGATALTPMASAAAQSRDERRAERQEQRTERRQERQVPQRAQRRQVQEERVAPRRDIASARRDASPRQLERASPRLEERRSRSDRRASRPVTRNVDRVSRTPAPVRTVTPSRNGTSTRHWDGGRRQHDWSRDWRRDRRYDWQGYRNTHRHIYNVGHYYSPYRWHNYRRFSIGFFLEPLFFGSRYWISDPWYYRLPPAYPGTRWVRYYDDVLLVDLYTGEVIDVIYDFFW